MKLVIVEPFGTGGITHYNYQLGTALSNQGVDVTYLTSTEYELHDLPHNFEVQRVLKLWSKFEPLPLKNRSPKPIMVARNLYRRFRRASILVREEIRMTTFLVREKPDVILFGTLFNFPFVYIFLWILRKKGINLTQICHESEIRKTGTDRLLYIVNWMNRQVYSLMDVIFVHAHSHRERFLTEFTDILPECVHVIAMGNEEFFLNYEASSVESVCQKFGLDRSDITLLFFGRISPDKGVKDLIDAFSIIKNNASQNNSASRSMTAGLRLVIAGPPVLGIAEKLEAQIEELKLADSIVLEASYIPSEEVKPLFEIADVAVYPYHNSSQSLALQAAYTCAVPVVVTNVGGLPETVEEGQSGYTVPAHSPEALAVAIEKIIYNPTLAIKMGQYGRHLSQTKHSWREISGHVLDIYDDIFTGAT